MASTIAARAERGRRLAGAAFALLVIGLIVAVYTGFTDLPGIDSGLGDDIRAIDEVWVLFSAALVFLMQAGFLCFEVGLARPQHTTAVAMKNVVDWTVGSFCFFIVGFGLMFGDSAGGIIGGDLFLLDGLFSGETDTTVTAPTFFLFQLAFAGTAITIVSGSLVERTSFLAYTMIALFMGAIMYPIYGHWVWGNLLDENNSAWLADLGFHDFAGGSTVHMVGGLTALVGVMMVGPRLGRFGEDGSIRPFRPSSMAFTVLGVVILWVGWWGFNGGSTLFLDRSVAEILVVTNMSAVAGLLGAGMFAYLYQGRSQINDKIIGGAVGGLVAITPGADVMDPGGAVLTGLIAGVLYSLAYDFLLKKQIDDALGVVPAHAVAGAFGLVAIGLFAPNSAFDGETLLNSRIEQIGVQLLGIVVCAMWVIGTAWVAFSVIQRTVGLRVSPEKERRGVDLSDVDELDEETMEEIAEIDDDELAKLLR